MIGAAASVSLNTLDHAVGRIRSVRTNSTTWAAAVLLSTQTIAACVCYGQGRDNASEAVRHASENPLNRRLEPLHDLSQKKNDHFITSSHNRCSHDQKVMRIN